MACPKGVHSWVKERRSFPYPDARWRRNRKYNSKGSVSDGPAVLGTSIPSQQMKRLRFKEEHRQPVGSRSWTPTITCSAGSHRAQDPIKGLPDSLVAEELCLPAEHLGHEPLVVPNPHPCRKQRWLTGLRTWGSGPRWTQGCGSYSKALRLKAARAWRELGVGRMA